MVTDEMKVHMGTDQKKNKGEDMPTKKELLNHVHSMIENLN